MVAAWIRAETGEGPSMASGSQTCRGNWADLPMAPEKISKAMMVVSPGKSASSCPAEAMAPSSTKL